MSHYARLETPANIRGDLTSTGRVLLLDWLVGGKQIPQHIWIGMSLERLGDSTTAQTLSSEVEPSYSSQLYPGAAAEILETGYKRQEYPFNAGADGVSWYSNAGGYYFNVSEIRFPRIPVNGTWPTVLSWFIATQEKRNEGDIIACGPTGELPASPGDQIIIPQGSLSLRVAPLKVS